MLVLSPDTEALARRLGEARGLSIDATVRDALETLERAMPSGIPTAKSMTSEVIMARIAEVDRIVSRVKALPDLDPRSTQEIVDDLNDV